MDTVQILEMLKCGPVHPARIVESKSLPAFSILRSYGCVTVEANSHGKPECRITQYGLDKLAKIEKEVA